MVSQAPIVRDWTIKRYEPGDEVAILGLFNQVFGLHRSLEHWRWQFAQNPYGGPFASQARRTADGALVGTHIVMPFLLNVRGRPVLAAQTLDLVVHPDYRKQGIFESSARDCFESMAPFGVKAVVAFPNASSYPGFVRTLKWMRLVVPARYTLRLDVEQDVRLKLKVVWLAKAINRAFRAFRGMSLPRETTTGLHYESSATLPDAYERLWQAHATHEILSVWKDSKYFRWRYDANPDHSFTYHWLARGGDVVAFTVTTEMAGGLTLCEWIVENRSVPLARQLLSEVCRNAFQRRLRSVSFLGHDSGFFASAFAGFRGREASENVFVGRALDDPELNELMAHAEHWTTTFGDADYV